MLFACTRGRKRRKEEEQKEKDRDALLKYFHPTPGNVGTPADTSAPAPSTTHAIPSTSAEPRQQQTAPSTTPALPSTSAEPRQQQTAPGEKAPPIDPADWPTTDYYYLSCLTDKPMAQWERLRQLDSVSRQQLDDLYDGDDFPMDVRHYLAPWIEKQEWSRAAQDHALALVVFQGLLENLDIQHGRFVQEEDFLRQHNFRRLKQNFQRYQEQPCLLARVIHWFLFKEDEILRNAELAEKVEQMQVQYNPVETDSQRNVQCKVDSLKNKVERMEYTVKCLEEQQDEFDFKFKIHNMEEATTAEAERNELFRALQKLLNELDKSRKCILDGLRAMLDAAEDLLEVLVNQELLDWCRRQQRACIGAPDSTSLEQLEKWFSTAADCLFQVRKFLMKLDELRVKLTYEQDPVLAQKPALQKRVDSLLTALLKSAFVVETQPSMPQGKGPLVLRTSVQFSVKTRLLVKIPELNHAMKVKVSMDSEAPHIKGYRRFNLLGTDSKALNMAESANGGMVADFRHLTLKEQKSGGGGKGTNDLSLSVTEELHVINFDTLFELHGFSVPLQASSLPVVIISNSSQQQSAWASVLWFNLLSENPKNIMFFATCPAATWPQFGEMLSWQFLSATQRGLDDHQLDMIAHKLFGKQESYEASTISWARFSKENVPATNFTFWVWFDGILVMVKTHLENLWRDGSIMGFVSKDKEKSLLRRKQRGTFLLRFSESVRDGAITFSWVDYTPSGKPEVRSVQPFTKADLVQIPFHEIIRNFQIQIPENVPESPLCFLYPNIPKDQAFGKYYVDKGGDESPYIKYIKTKLVFVSKENTAEAKSPVFSGAAAEGEGSGPMNGLSEEAADLGGILLQPHEDLLSDPDPMLPGSDAALDDEADILHTDLLLFLSDPIEDLPIVSDLILDLPLVSDLSDEQVFPELALFPYAPALPCGTIFP